MQAMKQRARTYFFCGLMAAVCGVQHGCSQQTAQAPASPSPSPIAQNAAPAGSTTPAPLNPAAAASASPVTSAATNPAEAPPRTFTLAAGRRLSIWTASTLSTKTNQSGEAFRASLSQPIVDGDWVIAKKGAPVEGVIVKADPGGRVKGVASMTIRLKRLTLADGRTVELSTGAFTQRARTTKKKDAAKIGIGAGIGAVIGAIAGGGKGAAIGAGVGGGAGTGVVLATRGDPATIPSEARLNFRLTAPVKVTKQ